MNANKYLDAKKKLHEKLGDRYPMCKNDLTIKFLLSFADYLDGPKEEDFGDDYKSYEAAKYNSEQWAFIEKMTKATYWKAIDDEKSFAAAWSEFQNWVTENYFPEYIR